MASAMLPSIARQHAAGAGSVAIDFRVAIMTLGVCRFDPVPCHRGRDTTGFAVSLMSGIPESARDHSRPPHDGPIDECPAWARLYAVVGIGAAEARSVAP